MTTKTLREICASTDVTRRAIQGYEAAGLVAASARNKYGHLLYDEGAEVRIRQIKFYQQIGFSVKEIRHIIDAADPVKKDALQEKLLQLKKDYDHYQYLIDKVTILLNSLAD